MPNATQMRHLITNAIIKDRLPPMKATTEIALVLLAENGTWVVEPMNHQIKQTVKALVRRRLAHYLRRRGVVVPTSYGCRCAEKIGRRIAEATS